MKSPLETFIVHETKAENRESLNKYIFKKLKETIDYTKENSRFYKEKFKDINIDNIKTLKDFNSIPFTYPKEVAERSFEFLCVPQRYIKRIVTLKTSGTTAADGKRIFFTEHDLNLTINFFNEGFKAMVNESDNIMIMMPGETYGSVGDIIKKSLDKLNVKSFIYGILKDCEDAGKFIENNNINSIVALPMQAMYLSKITEDIFKKHIGKLMLSADYVPEVLIKRFKLKYNCKVFTHYGLTETGYGLAVECQQLDGYHARENDVYLEIVDPHTGEVLQDDRLGEIVVTTLNRQAMPLIRYRTGDYGAYKSNVCKCGTFLKTLKRSKGRINNKIFFNNYNIHMSEFDEIIFQYDSVLDYSINIISEKTINIIIYLLNDSDEISEEIKELIKKELYVKFNKSIDFKIISEKKENVILSPNTMIKRTL